MKILYLSNSKIPSRTANSIHVMKMCNAFVKNGHDVYLMCEQNGRITNETYDYYDTEKGSFKIYPFKYRKIKGLGRYIYSFHSKKLSSVVSPDLIYGRNLYSIFLCRNLNIPLIYESHSPPNNRIQLVIQKMLFENKNFRSLVVISAALKNEYVKTFGKIVEDKIIIAHDGADPVVRKEHDIITEVNKIGYIGHLYPGRGIELIGELSKSLPEHEFHLVGGIEEDIEYWKQKFYTRKNIIFHGYVPHSGIEEIRKKFDVLIAPYQKKVSVSGGKGDTSKWMSPLKIFEYMSSGKPIISSDIKVLREVLENNYNSILCDPENTNEWINAIIKLSNDMELSNKIAKTAQNNFLNKYTWDVRAEKVLNKLYK